MFIFSEPRLEEGEFRYWIWESKLIPFDLLVPTFIIVTICEFCALVTLMCTLCQGHFDIALFQ